MPMLAKAAAGSRPSTDSAQTTARMTPIQLMMLVIMLTTVLLRSLLANLGMTKLTTFTRMYMNSRTAITARMVPKVMWMPPRSVEKICSTREPASALALPSHLILPTKSMRTNASKANMNFIASFI